MLLSCWQELQGSVTSPIGSNSDSWGQLNMASGSYWHKFTESRLSRRRALALTGAAGTGLAALGLIGCGSGSSGGSSQAGSSGAQSSLLSQPVDTTAQAKSGGVIKNY